MITCLGKSCYFRLLCERLSNIVSVLLSLFGIEDGMLDMIVLIPDHCLSILLCAQNLYSSV